MIILTKPDQIQMARLLAMRGRLRLELKGIRFKGQTILPGLRQFLDLPRGAKRKEILEALEAYIDARL